MPVSIRFALADRHSFELLCGDQSRRVDRKEIESLAAAADGDHLLPQLIALGQSLYKWLDGNEGWLRTGLTRGETVVLLDLAAPLSRKLTHLPWELLHDGQEFLAGHGVQPIRVTQSRTSNARPANRPLRLLLMATSPEDVTPVLDYEREESAILEATARQPIRMVVEESGSVSQLREVVANFGPEYFDVFHIAAPGTIQNGTPRFLTEDEVGGKRLTTVEELAEAFGHRWPQLLFLSGCHAAESPDSVAVSSMACALVNAGADTVVCWARPVYDSTGSFAATEFYRALATGETPPAAVAATRLEMLRTFLKDTRQLTCSDWHLLRIYQGATETAALVTPCETPQREQIERKAPAAEFLDAEGNVKVAGASAFFGRRREMQRCLQALAHPSDSYGVFLHGMGGYGKSTVAARLCRRHEAQNPGFERVVLVGPVDEFRLRQRLGDRFDGMAEAVETLNRPKIEFRRQLKGLFELIERQGRKLLLVLDDFEQNIPEANVADGSLWLTAGAWSALQALCFALEESGTASRLIVTCRYYLENALPDHRLFVQELSGMAPADIGKKTRAMVEGVPAGQRNSQREAKIVKVADGNPRLLEWLMALPPDVIEDAFLDRLGAEVNRFRAKILARKLIGALREPERKALARMTLFELAVPMAVVAELAEGASLEAAVCLRLLEKRMVHGECLYRVTSVLDPLLRSALSEEEWSDARRRAARKLYEVWWEGREKQIEPRGLEIVRISVSAGEAESAVVPANAIAGHWFSRGRYQEAAALCRSVLAMCDDDRILRTMARAKAVLADS
jgi:hypothetical protein